MVKAIIFDCFGVLVGRGFEETYRIAGGDPVADKDFINDVLGQANLGMIDDEAFHDAMTNRLGIDLADWRHAVITAEQTNEELLSFVKDLHGQYKTAVLSNANSGVVERRIGQKWIEQCFDEVIVSADVGLVKPDPEVYKYAADKLGVATGECIFVDDKTIFLEAAGALGMGTVLYENFEQAATAIEQLLTNPKS
jgi:HAD superfamily hydrolase (TIGR01509 family)